MRLSQGFVASRLKWLASKQNVQVPFSFIDYPLYYCVAAHNMSSSIPRFLLPRGYAFPHPLSKAVRRPWCRDGQTYPLCKRASTNAPPPKIIRLEMPTKFNPPSHGRRLKQQLPRHYGPELTQQEKVQQKTKKYPKMMPPPDSFMYWFITSRGVHVFITLVRLGSWLKDGSSTH